MFGMDELFNNILSYTSSLETSSYQKTLTKLKQQQLELDKTKNANDAKDLLIQLSGTYEDIGLQIKQTESNIASANEYINRFDNGYYDLEMAKQENAIATLMENWAEASSSYSSNLTAAQNALALTEQSYSNSLFGLESNITGLQNWLGNYADYYDTTVGRSQMAIDQYNDWLSGYDDRYALTMNSMFQGSIGTLRQLQGGLAQQQVAMAARGQGGATSTLLAQMQQQEIYNMAGRDMTLDAEGGLYGQQYTVQKNELETQKRQTEAARDQALKEQEQTIFSLEEELRQNQDKLQQVQNDKSLTEAERDEKLRQLNEQIDTLKREQGSGEARYQRELAIAQGEKTQADLDLQAQRQTILNNLGVTEEALASLERSKKLYYSTFNEALASTIEAAHYAGDTYSDLASEVDKYKDILGLSDADFEQVKADLIDKYKPIDFEIRQDWYTYDISEENSHIRDYVTNIYDKATGKLATQEQIENILRTYAGNLKEKDWYTKGFWMQTRRMAQSGVTSQGLSDKALKAIIKNSNYNTRKNYK